MGINKNLNVDPYYDDFDEDKQFNRILFKPSKAIQARELTQLQTILQMQVERFGSNIYKEGTIISGVNLTERRDLFYVKVKDQPGFTNPALYNEIVADDGTTTRYILRGTNSGLDAEIVVGLPGFETSAPNLKTFYISYLNTNVNASGTQDVKQFGASEQIQLLNSDLTAVLDSNGSPITFTTAESIQDQVGRAFGVSCEDGVIYQRGHFIHVDRQLIIVTRYSGIPGQDGLDPENPNAISDVSVGFNIAENIVNSNLDPSLLDNANGFNNYQAPGADRLQILPTLSSFTAGNEPEDFFALIKYTDGKAVRLRDTSEYSLLGEELARRTYEESGHYVIKGLDCKLSKTDTVASANITPGKAYVFGKEVKNLTNKKLDIDPLSVTQSQKEQATHLVYDQHYEFDLTTTHGSGSDEWPDGIDFTLGGSTLGNYNLLENTTIIGTCNVLNVGDGKVFVANIKKKIGKESTPPTHIAMPGYNGSGSRLELKTDGNGNPLGLKNTDQGCLVFSTGKIGISSIESLNLVRRIRLDNVQLTSSVRNIDSDAITEAGPVGVPQASSDVIAIKSNGKIVKPASVTQRSDSQSVGQSDGIAISFSGVTDVSTTETFDHLYYNKAYYNVTPDTLTEATGYVKTKFNSVTKVAELGIPNVVQIEKIFVDTDANSDAESLVDVTDKFRLVRNAKDSHYDLSYIQLKAGETEDPLSVTVKDIIVEFKYLRRSSNGGYLVKNSYAGVSKNLILPHQSRNGSVYYLNDSIDLRPYAQSRVAVANDITGVGQAAVADGLTGEVSDNYLSQAGVADPANLVNYGGTLALGFANDTIINSTHNYFLARRDCAVIDEYGNISLVKGKEASQPVPPTLGRVYKLADILIPGDTIEILGRDSIQSLSTTTKVSTMDDMSRLKKQVNDLTKVVHKGFADQELQNLSIVSSISGLERHKNGVLSDSFGDLSLGDVLNPQFKAGINKVRRVATPRVTQFPIDLKLDTVNSTGISDEVQKYQFDNFTTIKPKDDHRVVVHQPYATNFRSCVSNYYNYQGSTSIYPEFSVGYDVTKNPEQQIEVDFDSNSSAFLKNFQEMIPTLFEEYHLATWWNAYGGLHWGSAWKRLGYLDSIKDSTGFLGAYWYKKSGFDFYERVETIMREYGLTDNQVEGLDEQLNVTVGNFITDYMMNVYMKSEMISIHVSGLRPNAKHYVYFDGKDVNEHCSAVFSPNYSATSNKNRRLDDFHHTRSPKLLHDSMMSMNHTGKQLLSDSDGRILFQFKIPPGEFFVGERVLEISDVSSYDSISSAGTSYGRAKYNAFSYDVESTDPDSTTRSVNVGSSESVLVGQALNLSAEANPLAQTFDCKPGMAENSTHMYLDSAVLYFKQKSSTQGVTIQIRKTINGVPTKDVLPNSTVYLRASDIQVSSDGTQGTLFGFNDPVRLTTNNRYAIVVIPDANSPDYLLWTSKVGSISKSFGLAAQQVAVNNDWGDGSLYSSSDDSAWSPIIGEDLKFYLTRLDFNTSASVSLVPNDVEFLEVRNNRSITPSRLVDGVVVSENEQIKEIVPFEVGEVAYVSAIANADASSITKDSFFNMTLKGDDDAPNQASILTSELPSSDTFVVGDSVLVENTNNASQIAVLKIESITTSGNDTILTFTGPFFEKAEGTEPPVKVTHVISGIVSHYDELYPHRLHLKESTARAGGKWLDNSPGTVTFGSFEAGMSYTITDLGALPTDVNARTTAWQNLGVPVGKVAVGTQFIALSSGSANLNTSNGTARPNNRLIIGSKSGAQATITSVREETMSYMAPQILIDQPGTVTETKTVLKGYVDENGNTVPDTTVDFSKNFYAVDTKRKIVSKSKRLADGDAEKFRFVTELTSFSGAVTPMVDVEQSELMFAQYQITNSADTSSQWISKIVSLPQGTPASGLRVLIDAYRPPGTNVDVYAKFSYVDDAENTSDWIPLTYDPNNAKLFSSSGDVNDIREYVWDLDETGTVASTAGDDYTQFQIRFTMRHMNAVDFDNLPEMNAFDVHEGIFPHMARLRAIAVT